MNTLDDYYKALERLINNKPINVPKNTKINNDTVALEAGRKRGSIKKSREIFADLLIKINEYSKNNNTEYKELQDKIFKFKNKALVYQELYENALNRELMLIERIKELELKIEGEENLHNVLKKFTIK
ncbi:hypothetical protein L5F68_05620 [Aliarcobacter butzleri]|uniref:hypothetical protein n=1 Tax=Aliarcobacter butzleri TaxID=28197 RepID=UPI001EDFBE51|nr:hypothetical protein [Aliarcobacter butzleri]MCG3703810.1 hypothetical protein [Aliarcobacter butzleri]